MGKFTKLLWFGTRAGIAGGAVYALNEQRVWSSDTDTRAIYERARQTVPQEVADFSQTYITPYVPSKKYLHLDLSQHWNNAVLATFGFLSRLPELTADAAQYTAALATQAMAAVADAAPLEEQSEKPAAAAQDSVAHKHQHENLANTEDQASDQK
ncbi:uncharacterized protein LOC108680479 [Hyalella azteca]|uniref:MICOS complex subunit MIC13 n=1 Tax=Hyalella azteca TaxID=294128 RepID=A0A8B7PF78_HYAAZ|nr:uncharacterized protein LOC108680479 [Hyalella azteca]